MNETSLALWIIIIVSGAFSFMVGNAYLNWYHRRFERRRWNPWEQPEND
jgi:hypothetical protein